MNIEQMLDALADYQAQADYLALEKKRLVDEVQVPGEVLLAQDYANKQRQQIDSDSRRLQIELGIEESGLMDTVEEPEMPPEYVVALQAAKDKRGAIDAEYRRKVLDEYTRSQKRKAQIDADLQAKVADVYAQVATRKSEINAEFDDKAKSVVDNIAKLTAEIKAAVIEAGHTVKGTIYQAVYMKGRVTWNTDKMDGIFFSLHRLIDCLAAPNEASGDAETLWTDILAARTLVNALIKDFSSARKEGEPSITLRKI
jgi:hypothetical protein